MSTRPYETRNGGKGINKKREREEGGSENSNSKRFNKKPDWFPEMEFRLKMKLNPEGVIEAVAKYFKGLSNKASGVLRGLPIVYPPAPNVNDFQVTAEDQFRLSEEMKEWRKDCKAYTADLLSIIDFLTSKCEGLLMKKLISEFTLMVLENKAQGHIVNPLLLLKSIIKHANGVSATNKREIQLRLEKELVVFKSGGQFQNETFDALLDRAKGLFSRNEQVNVLLTEEEKVDIFFLAVNPNRYPELVSHYAASIRKKPEIVDRESVDWRIWYATYKDVYATNLEDACERAKEYRPEVKFYTQNDFQNQFATQKTKPGGKSSDNRITDYHHDKLKLGKQPVIENGKCFLCQKEHHIAKCPYLYDMQNEVKARESTQSSKPVVSDGKHSHKTIDFAFANVLFRDYVERMEMLKGDEIEGWMAQYATLNPDKVVALFDPCSTFTLMRLRKMVKNIRKCQPLSVITTMGTYNRIQHVGDNKILPGDIYYDDQSDVNIICAHDLLTNKDIFKVRAFEDGTYDITHKPSGHVFRVRWYKKVLVVDITICADM